MAEAAELAHREQAAAVVVRVFFDGSAFLNCRLLYLSLSALVVLPATQAPLAAQVPSAPCFLHTEAQVEPKASQALEVGHFPQAVELPAEQGMEQSIQALQRGLQPIAAVAEAPMAAPLGNLHSVVVVVGHLALQAAQVFLGELAGLARLAVWEARLEPSQLVAAEVQTPAPPAFATSTFGDHHELRTD